jgi:integrase
MPKALRLPLDHWPPADRSAWERVTAPVDYFDDLAPAARWSQKTRYQAQAAYGRWLAFLRDRFPEALTLAPAERVDRVRAGVYVEALAVRVAAMSVAAELGHLIMMLGVLAPREAWGWLRQWQYRYQKQAVGRDKRGRMVHPVRLLELGIGLMDSAEIVARPDERARQYRDGLLIALLTCRPLRRRSLSELTMGTHVRRAGERYVLAVPGIDTKSGEPIEFPVPDCLTRYMTRYLEQYRLLFPKAGEYQALWLSAKGGALRADAIYAAICRRTEAAFGRAIHPHLFRDIAVTTIARQTPEALHLSRDLLTHANIETTLRHYSQAKTIDAARKHLRLLAALRSGSATGHSPTPRPERLVSRERRIPNRQETTRR